jgi:acetoin utilization deacetylase AcuC-like enzyme
MMISLSDKSAGADDPGAGAGRTGWVAADTYLKHLTGAGHPERPERLIAISNRLRECGVLPQLLPIRPRAATPDEIGAVHAPAYVRRVAADCREGIGYVDSPDAPASVDSYAVALEAAGGVLAAVDAVMGGQVRNAFCAVRPPGHHALTNRAMGFCLFNNVAIAARYLQRRHKLNRILIVDWDVHHGNGTQATFYADPTVFYFSAHQSPLYPGTGGADETGEGEGRGFTLNVPLPPGTGDTEYGRVFEERLRPAAAAFRPEFVLLSAGFDAAQGDLLGGMRLTPAGYASLTRLVKAIAAEHCQGRLVATLEGGYNLDRLAACVEAHVRALSDGP